jgi:hypothetical protein
MASELRAGIVPLLSALVGGLVVAIPTYLSSNRQIDVKMVEIAVNILGQKPEPNIQPARYWAVDVIKAYSKVPLSPEVQAALIENRAFAPSSGWYVDSYVDYVPGSRASVGSETPLKEPSKAQ